VTGTMSAPGAVRQGGVSFAELQRWRLIAAIAWCFPCYCLALCITSLPQTFPAWSLSTVLLLTLPFSVLFAEKDAIGLENAPLPNGTAVLKLLAAEGTRYASKVLHTSRAGQNKSSPRDVDPKKNDDLESLRRSALVELVQGASRRWLVVYAAAVSCGFATSLYVSARPHDGKLRVPVEVSFMFGVLSGFFYGLWWSFFSGRTQLSFPVIHRHRFFRLKAALPSIVSNATVCTTVTVVVFSILQRMASALLSSSDSFSTLNPMNSTLLGLAFLYSVLCWEFTYHILHFTTTEGVVFAQVKIIRNQQPTYLDGTINVLLEHALQPTNPPLLRYLAFRDLCKLSEDPSSVSHDRRQAIFEESGDSWRMLSAALLEPLTSLCGQIEDILKPQGPSPQQEPLYLYGSSLFHSKVKTAFKSSQLVMWACRSLVALVGASYTEDSFGVVQLHGSIEEVLGILLATWLLVERVVQISGWPTSTLGSAPFLGPAASWGYRLQTMGGIAHSMPVSRRQRIPWEPVAIADVLRVGLNQLVNIFGEELRPLAKSPSLWKDRVDGESLSAALAHLLG